MLYRPYKEIQIIMQIGLYILRILLIVCVFQKVSLCFSNCNPTSITLILKEECTALKCYQCNSKKDEDCSINNVHFKYLKLCPSDHFYCRKAVYVYYFMDSYNDLILRECAKSRNTQKKCYQGHYTRDSYQLICECIGYGCNQSQQCSPNLIIHFLCILFVIANYFITRPNDSNVLIEKL